MSDALIGSEDVVEEARPEPRTSTRSPGRKWEELGWEREAELEEPAPPVARRPVAPREAEDDGRGERRQRALPDHVTKEITAAVGARRGPRLEVQLADAARAFERERYGDAARISRRIVEEAPDMASARELLGLCLYRQEKWAEALRHLDRFVELTGSVEQNPVLADCHRALRHYETVAQLWEELVEQSPSAELVAEGRIVMAGALGDQGRLADAIALLERASKPLKRPRPHNLRMWYALADLYERAGDVPRARDLFVRVQSHDPELGDVEGRIRSLR